MKSTPQDFSNNMSHSAQSRLQQKLDIDIFWKKNVKSTPSSYKCFLVILSFEIKLNLLMEHKTRGSSLTFLVRELSLIFSFTKKEGIATFATP